MALVHPVLTLIAKRTYVRHWVARILCLMIVPFCTYALFFKIHFLILNHSGSGDSQMSSLFQAHLVGNDFANNPLGPFFLFLSRSDQCN